MEKLTPDIPTHSFTQIADEVDRLFQAKLSRSTMGLSPAGLTEVYVSWLAHLALCPGRMAALACFPLHHFKGLAAQAMEAPHQTAKLDPRFKSEDWSALPWKGYVDLKQSWALRKS